MLRCACGYATKAYPLSADVTRSGPSQAEIDALERRHRDIAKHGAGALKLMEEKAALQQRRVDYCLAHDLSCFKCGTRLNDWARCGKTNGRYWAICVQCVRKPRQHT